MTDTKVPIIKNTIAWKQYAPGVAESKIIPDSIPVIAQVSGEYHSEKAISKGTIKVVLAPKIDILGKLEW